VVVLGLEALCLSTQSVISLSVKTMLKHADSVFFLLNPAWFLSVKRPITRALRMGSSLNTLSSVVSKLLAHHEDAASVLLAWV
jgi:hypothetical protein